MISNYEKATSINRTFASKIKDWIFGNPILVYSVGKVGSSSIVNSLRYFHIKEVQPHSLQISRKGSYFVLPKFNTLDKLFIYFKSLLIKLKTQIYLKSKQNDTIKVLSIYREPISRNISAFFEQHHHVLKDTIDKYSTNELISAYWEFCNHDAPLNWYSEEILKTFNINVFNYPFDKDKGYCLIKEGNVELLLLTMENLNGLEKVLGEFLGLQNFILTKANRAEKKVYSSQYQMFKNEIIIPKTYMEKFYNSKVMNHFYSQSDIKGFVKLWEIK